MIDLKNISKVYFIGIGGIGMSALARYFKSRGALVEGYDRMNTPLTKKLIAEEINITFSDHIDSLNSSTDLVVYTPAIPSNNIQLNWYRENGFTVVKRSDILQAITAEKKAICVAGTHGKTTVSAMIAFLLTETGFGCQAFLGGIAANYNSNFINAKSDWCVVEADEYDRSFLKLNPNISVVTSMDADHLDIYGTAEEMEKAYFEFVNKTSDALFYKHGLKQSKSFTVAQQKTYSTQNDSAHIYAQNIMTKNGTYHFDVFQEQEEIGRAELNMGGMHNIENAMAALSICLRLGIPINQAIEALKSFKGVKRRFEYIVKNDKHIYIDDYAHHPEELKQLIQSAQSLFRNKKISIVFQPHLYSRTQDHAIGFAKSLEEADEVILMDIYPARELPIDGVSSGLIKDAMQNPNVNILSKDGILEWVNRVKPDVLITAGAGDIDQLIEPIKEIINES